jgi:hypothetical protein
MTNTLDAGVIPDSVIRMFSLKLRERERSCAYFLVESLPPNRNAPEVSSGASVKVA